MFSNRMCPACAGGLIARGASRGYGLQWKHKKRMLVMSNPVINPNGVLKGKIALVTGASRGIGEAIAVRLAMEGARVVCTARTAEEGESRLPGTLTGASGPPAARRRSSRPTCRAQRTGSAWWRMRWRRLAGRSISW